MLNRKYDDTVTILKKDGTKYLTNTVQDCEGILKEVRKAKDINGGRGDLGYKAASIPQVMLHRWGAEDCPTDPLCYFKGRQNRDPELAKKLAKRLNSSEFRDFRIWEGTVASSDFLKEGKKA